MEMDWSDIRGAEMAMVVELEYSDSARVWKVGGVWNTIQRAELAERMKRLRATNTQPDNSTLRRMEGQEMTHLRQQLREMTRQLQLKARELAETIQQKVEIIQQKEATIQRNKRELERIVEIIQQKKVTIQRNRQELHVERNAETIQQKEATIRINEQELEKNVETIQQNDTTIQQLQSDIRELQIQQKNDVIQRHKAVPASDPLESESQIIVQSPKEEINPGSKTKKCDYTNLEIYEDFDYFDVNHYDAAFNWVGLRKICKFVGNSLINALRKKEIGLMCKFNDNGWRNLFLPSLWKTPLHRASEPEVFQVLLSHGATVDMKDKYNRTPLHYASEPEVVQVLRATVDMKDMGSDVQKIMRRPEDNEHSLTLLSKEQLKNKSSTNTPNETF